MVVASLGQILRISAHDIWSYRTNRLCDGRTHGRTPNIFMSPPPPLPPSMASPWRGTIMETWATYVYFMGYPVYYTLITPYHIFLDLDACMRYCHFLSLFHNQLSYEHGHSNNQITQPVCIWLYKYTTLLIYSNNLSSLLYDYIH